MITLLSPAKTLDFESELPSLPATTPDFLEHTALLVQRARSLSREEIQGLMSISETLATLNHERFRDFVLADEPPGRPAALAFQGDVYQGLDAASLPPEVLEYSQDHLRILSGLYGLLRPLDRIQPYRLEMGSKLDNERGKNLYEFWGGRLAEALDQSLGEHAHPVLVNLASNEYFKAVPRKVRRARVVTPVFQETKDGVPKVISFVAKRSRGAMARWILENRIEDPEGLKDFSVGGYRLVKKESSEDKLVFRRKFRSMAKK